jgi:dipeptidyl aminopeptidase/acylaminoacyl peptidase
MDDTFLDALLTLPEVDAAQLSPDRRWVAFTWEHAGEHTDVYLVPADGSAPPLALTATPEETRLVRWAPDSRAVVVAEDHAGDERLRLFRVAVSAPGVMEPLTEERPSYFLCGGDLSPDGRTLFYSMNYDVASGRTLETSVIYRHDLAGGERTPIAGSRRASWAGPLLNSAGTHLLHTRVDRAPGGEQVHLIDVEGGEDREILSAGDNRKARAEWLPDGRRALFVAESADAGYQRVGLYDILTGETRMLLDEPARQVESAWSTPDGLVVVDEVRDARHVPVVLDPVTGAEVPVPRAAGNLLPLGRAADGAWVALRYDSTTPRDVVRLEDGPGGPVARSLTRFRERASLNLSTLTPAEDFRWHSVDGMEIQGWLYRARPNPGRAVLYIHGGPTWHSEEWLNVQVQYLVRCGFNVLDVNYRGSTGFGMTFREAIKADGWGGREQADIAAAAHALIDAGLASPGRVGVTGTSYGGYSAWCQIVHQPPELIAAAAPICGMTDLVVDYETTRPDLRPYSEEMIGGAPHEVPERYAERSPINFVAGIRGRLLIVQGARDPNVTPENVRVVALRLDAAGILYERLEFTDEGHGIHRPANQAVLYRRLAQFFDEALGPPYSAPAPPPK